MRSLLKKQFHWNLLNFVSNKQIPTSYIQRTTWSSTVPSSGMDVPPAKMRGRLASNEQKRIITKFVTEANTTKVDWNSLKTSVLSIDRGYINTRNINGCILETCSKQNRLDLVKSYMNHLKGCGETKPNFALELLYIRSCYTSQDQLTDDDRHEIQITCQSLFKKNSHLLNSVLLEGIVMGICCTPLWRESMEYLKALKNRNDVTINTLVCIITKAFDEAEIDLGWTLTHDIFNRHETLPIAIFAAWFNLCEKNINFSHLKVLEFLRDSECIVRIDLAELIRDKFKQFGSQIATTVINHNNGKCKNCNQVLKPVEVTNSEFKMLQERFMSNVMIGKNIFNNSSPQELNDFKDFIEVTGPYDVVVDGLNLAYAYRGKIVNNSITKIVMKTFIEQNLKVLLIGRKHLVQMLGNEFNFIRKNCHIFFTNDLSKDDPFVLYAAMYSGLGTKILTRDLMRSHKFLLGDSEMKNIFQKWLQKHRLVLKIRPGNYVNIKDPITHLQGTQESKNGIWHLPYQEFKEPGSWSKPDSSPDKWMCIKNIFSD